MQVPLLDLKGQYAPLRTEIEAAIREVCDEQRFVLGPKVAELEKNIAAYSQTKHGLGLSSGTDALLLALMALDIGPGDEVITTPFTFFATAGVVARLQARPFFCDIDAATFNLDPAAVRAAIAEHLASVPGYSALGAQTFARPVSARHWLQASNPSERWKWDFMFQDLPPVKFGEEFGPLPRADVIPLKEVK